MKVSLASSAELLADHRRTASRRKRARIAAELQRRHDDLNCPPGFEGDRWWVYVETIFVRQYDGGPFVPEDRYVPILRFDFALWLP